MELVLYEGETAAFTCRATGRPTPVEMSWSINRNPIPGLAVTSEAGGGAGAGFLEQSVSAPVEHDWDGRTLTCAAGQLDDEGNAVKSSDERTIRVERRAPERSLGAAVPAPRSGEFRIVDRYPEGAAGDSPELLISPGAKVTFSCTSSLAWHVCRWKRPNSGDLFWFPI